MHLLQKQVPWHLVPNMRGEHTQHDPVAEIHWACAENAGELN